MSFISFSDLQTVLTDLGTKLRKKPTAVRLTQAQYNALTNEQKHDTTKTYYITDGQGGGGGGTGVTETVLYSQNYGSFPNTITLSNSFDQYNYLVFFIYKADDNSYYDVLQSSVFPKEQLLDILNGNIGSDRTNVFNVTGWQPNNSYVRLAITDTTTFTKVQSSGSVGLSKIVGIKF